MTGSGVGSGLVGFGSGAGAGLIVATGAVVGVAAAFGAVGSSAALELTATSPTPATTTNARQLSEAADGSAMSELDPEATCRPLALPR